MRKSSTNKRAVHSDTSTLDGARYILAVKNESKRDTEGPLTVGSAVLCLRNDTGYYVPCVATVVSVTPSGRVTVDLYTNKSQRVTVTKKAILWQATKSAQQATPSHFPAPLFRHRATQN